MKKYGITGIVAVFFLFGCGGGPASADGSKTDAAQTVDATPREGDFAAFWTDFREAALDGNMDVLKEYTEFPLQTRGMMDNEPVITYSRNEFEPMFALFLQTPTGLNSNNFNETQLDYMRVNPTVTFNENRLPMMQDGKKASVASMQFELTLTGWKLKFIYLTDEVYQKTGKSKTV